MNFFEKNGLNKKQAIILCTTFLFGAMGFCYALYQLAVTSTDSYRRYIDILLYLVTFDYAIHGYKVPHGETLKLTMLLFALSLGFKIVFSGEGNGVFGIVASCCLAVATVAVSFMCGRLNRYNENKGFIAVVYIMLGIFAGVGIASAENLFSGFEALNPIVQWAMLSSVYMVRFHLHKEAGLSDKQ